MTQCALLQWAIAVHVTLCSGAASAHDYTVFASVMCSTQSLGCTRAYWRHAEKSMPDNTRLCAQELQTAHTSTARSDASAQAFAVADCDAT
eukprot:17128-Heterococcus_DN1.PRE.3